MSTVDLLPDPIQAAAALKAPSERAQEIYYQATIESRSQREIAKEFQLSQPRVHQIVAKVMEWVGDTLPGVAGEMTARQRFQVAKQITRDRLMYYPGLLVEKFHQSCEPIQVQITKPGCEPEIKIKNGQPKPQLLKAAADIAATLPRFELEMMVAEAKHPVLASAVAPVSTAPLSPAEISRETGDGALLLPIPATHHPSPAPINPPNGDLSAAGQEQPALQLEPIGASSANRFSKIPYGVPDNGHAIHNDFCLPPKKALSRREQQIARRRQKAARKQERRRPAAASA